MKPFERQQNCPEALRRFLDGESYVSQASSSGTEAVSTSQGRIITRVHGSHVDITVSLSQLGARLNLAVGVLILVLAAVVGLQIYTAFASGRVRQILDQNAGAQCAAIGDPVAAAECLYLQKKAAAAEPVETPEPIDDQARPVAPPEEQ